MTEKEYEYILNPKTGKLVKTCGNIGTKLIRKYEYEEIYNPETKRTVNVKKTTGKKVYKKYEKYIEKYYKKGGSPITALAPCPASINVKQCTNKPNNNQSCTLKKFKYHSQPNQQSCRFKLTPSNSNLNLKNKPQRSFSGTNVTNVYFNTPAFVNNKNAIVNNTPANINEKSYNYSYIYDNITYKVSSTLNTINKSIVVQHDPPNPPNPPNPPKSTITYKFDCEPLNANARKVCNSDIQKNQTLEHIFQILAEYIDTIVMLLYPQFISIFTVESLKNIVIEYIFNKILNLVIPEPINNGTNLVPIIVRSMMGDNVITISAKLTLKTFASGYTENLPQVIIKKKVISLFDYVQNLKSENKVNTNVINEVNTNVINEVSTNVNTEVKKIVDTISVNFGITVKEEVKNS